MRAIKNTRRFRHAVVVTAVVIPSALGLASCGATSSGSSPDASSSTARTAAARDVLDSLQRLEAEFDARVGIAATDTGNGTKIDYRSDERFGYASTLKALAAAQFLREIRPADRQERVTWTQADVDAAGYSPVTSRNVPEGLTLDELAEAAVRDSDNTAMKLVLKAIGGPPGLDKTLTQLGDAKSRVINTEPDLNIIEPGSTADTTTPATFTADLAAYLSGSVLKPRDREIWLDWMSGNPTGDHLIRAGAPTDWVVADKSGGAGAIRNDIAIVTPPGRKPILITILTHKVDPTAPYDDALVSRAAALTLDALR